MKSRDLIEAMNSQGIAIPAGRLDEFQRNYQDLRALIDLIRMQAFDTDPWTPPGAPAGGAKP